MIDRFKFRAKRIDNNRFIEGYLCFIYIDNPNKAQIYCPYDCYNYDVYTETIAQCTGLKDKNGKLIYEGDIVKFGDFYEEWHSFHIGKVYWGGKYDYPAFELQCSTADFDMCNGLSYIFGEGLSIEVIGNIYENIDLLEVKHG